MALSPRAYPRRRPASREGEAMKRKPCKGCGRPVTRTPAGLGYCKRCTERAQDAELLRRATTKRR